MNPHFPPGGRLARRSVTLVAAVAAFVAVTAALSAAARGAGPGAGPKSGTVFVRAGSVATVDLVSVPGQLTVVGAAPRRVSVALRSAQATVWLPGGVAYAVSGQVTDGYLHAGIPQAVGAPRTLTARIVSGELDLLAR
jgi:hypothetical protein